MKFHKTFSIHGLLALLVASGVRMSPAQDLAGRVDTLEISIPDTLAAFAGDTVSVPVLLQKSPNAVSSLGAAIKATNSLLTFINFTPGPIVPGAAIGLSAPQPDSVRMAFVDFGDGPIVAAGRFVTLDFLVDSTATDGASAALLFSDLSASDSTINSLVLSGRPGKVTVKKVVSVGRTEEPLPHHYQLFQNYPNPFNPTTSIKYYVPGHSHVLIEVFDLLGKRVEVLVDSFQPAGYYQVFFDPRDLPSGIYVYRLSSGSHIEARKMVLVR